MLEKILFIHSNTSCLLKFFGVISKNVIPTLKFSFVSYMMALQSLSSCNIKQARLLHIPILEHEIQPIILSDFEIPSFSIKDWNPAVYNNTSNFPQLLPTLIASLNTILQVEKYSLLKIFPI